MLKDLIDVVGLDKSFFYQFVIVACTYFISKYLFLKPYYELVLKRQNMTEGRQANTQDLEKETENLKQTYEEKARKIQKDFLSVFSKKKEIIEASFNEKKSELIKQYNEQTDKKRQEILQAQQKQEQELSKDISGLAESLASKIKGPSL